MLSMLMFHVMRNPPDEQCLFLRPSTFHSADIFVRRTVRYLKRAIFINVSQTLASREFTEAILSISVANFPCA